MTIQILRLASSFCFVFMMLFLTVIISFTKLETTNTPGQDAYEVGQDLFEILSKCASGDWLILSEVEDQPALLGILPERLRRLAYPERSRGIDGLSEVEDQPALLGILPERLRRIARLLFKKAHKIRGVFIAQLIGDLFHLAGAGQQISLCFEYDLFIDEFRNRFAYRGFGDGVQLVYGKIEQGRVFRNAFYASDMAFQEAHQVFEAILGIIAFATDAAVRIMTLPEVFDKKQIQVGFDRFGIAFLFAVVFL